MNKKDYICPKHKYYFSDFCLSCAIESKRINKRKLYDILIYITECLKQVDGIDINWRVIKKYADDFLERKDEV